MRREVKICLLALIVVLATLTAFGTMAYMAPTVARNNTQCSKLESSEENCPKSNRREFSQFPPRREFSEFPPKALQSWVLDKAWFFLKDANKTTYTGEILLVSDHILVLNVTGETVNIIMAQKWVSDENVSTLHDLFVNETLSVGQEVTINALEYAVKNIYFAFGYKITTETATIPALLPFNIR